MQRLQVYKKTLLEQKLQLFLSGLWNLLVNFPVNAMLVLHFAGFRSGDAVLALISGLVAWVSMGRRFTIHIHSAFNVQYPMDYILNFIRFATNPGAHARVLIDGFEIV